MCHGDQRFLSAANVPLAQLNRAIAEATGLAGQVGGVDSQGGK